ncbi:hypothetical protein [Agrobacterium pusense]|jgi:hypothetical protein|uniref:hypothetical protein n=1 Tax=Agrobacterium pusense TaxID=648995 RepID=UPI0022B86763|nr:hypothetical protein [Agrobacterium pusense]MCZ7926194.1 hypothetical protein [Agrobacterium pusense]
MTEDGRKSPEHIEHLRAIGFKKGREKTGGRKRIPQEIKDAMALASLDAVQVINDLMHSADKDSVRLNAAMAIIAPFVPKAPRQSNVHHSHDLTALLREINGGKTIDVTPQVDAIEYDDDDYETNEDD